MPLSASMWSVPVQIGPDGDNAVRVNRVVAVVIVVADVVEMGGLCHAFDLVKLTGVGPKVRVFDQLAAITFEMPMVNDIEPNERRPETPIGFGQGVACQITVGREDAFEPIEAVEQRAYGFFIRGLAGGKA